ncbi:CxC2 domain-containing protein [Mycena sanguinolenta]|uniref:CxC2 domain-containing protein n=1 Tax=Mycena sanguinolenta TaxID=230812 RepID=A0A8H6XJH2_9AGAR|nr:CxC2 domain-containing protein [Mycena sanguinolenta]
MSSNRGGRGRGVLARRRDQLYVGADAAEETTLVADSGIYFSQDGRRRNEELLNVAHKKQKLTPTRLDDALAVWIPVPVDEEDLAGNDIDNTPPSDDAGTVLGKRKTYESSTDPMNVWRPHADFFLDEISRHDALGDNGAPELTCSLCKCTYIPRAAGPDAVRLFKCGQCGEFLQCKKCCLAGHARTPLHMIQEWNGDFWIDTTLLELGLVYQLGHGGMPCPYPDPRLLTMTVMDLPLIHRVKYRYCKCSKSDTANNVQQCLRNKWYPATVTDPGTCATFTTLETFRLQNVVGNINVHDFVTAMERQTNATVSTGMDWVPHRYKEFMRMSRQWAFLKRAKRSGRAHDPVGVAGTKARQCAVCCWACPHDKRNLPPNWRNVEKKYRFLYMLLVALDANFKLKNRMRANEHPDPPLGPGWGYFVEPEKYRKHLKTYTSEQDVSTCIAFAALLQKDSRGTAGLRTSGVGGCVCARHECVLPNGIGDLQKGERFLNMDYILLAALMGFVLMLLTISYDIACQWKRNFPTRNSNMPKEMQLPLDKIHVQCALPVWHAGTHDEECESANSLSFKLGVGKSDGEGVERTWAVLNPASYHTKDMSKGNRIDTLEDKIDSHNFLKNLGLGDALRRKLAVARAERDRQVKAFKEVSKTVEKDLQEQWQSEVEEWQKDATKPNPYTVQRQEGPSEAQVRLQLKKDEEQEAASGKSPLHGTSATAFLTAGLQIEEAQRRIIAEVGGRALQAPEREARIQELRLTLLKKISAFRKLQATYVPGAARAIQQDEKTRDEDSPPLKAEHIKLYMPHELAEEDRARERITASAQKYRKARAALVALKGTAFAPHFKELKDDDIRLPGENDESDAAARKKLAKISAGRGGRTPRNGPGGPAQVADPPAGERRRVPRNAPGESKRIMSWIWTARAGSGDDQQDLHDSIRVEWSRAKARKTRWQEEVELLQEEMRRTLRYLEWQATWWEARQDSRPTVSHPVKLALRAYALKQAWLHRRLAPHFKSQWETSTVIDFARVMEEADLAQFFEEK